MSEPHLRRHSCRTIVPLLLCKVSDDMPVYDVFYCYAKIALHFTNRKVGGGDRTEDDNP
jgi:hypothetical protein